MDMQYNDLYFPITFSNKPSCIFDGVPYGSGIYHCCSCIETYADHVKVCRTYDGGKLGDTWFAIGI